MPNALHLTRANVVLQQKTCLSDITVSFANKGVSVIVGSNGAGKTLLLKLCAGLLTPTSGQCKWTQAITSPQLTWVPQKPVLLQRTVFDNIALPLKNQKLDATARANAALQWADIESLSYLPALTLSTGQQQLVALARAWALDPQWLLLDEPCANLDPSRQQHINQLILALSQSGCRIIMSSHHLAQVKLLADNIIFMHQGKMLGTLTKECFFHPDLSTDISVSEPLRQKIETFIRYA